MKKAASITTLPATTLKRRCATYTRVSIDENLDQVYNSLHSQFDACSAFVRSQQAEGWIPNPDHYDNRGFSGGTLERPALQRLIADIKSRFYRYRRCLQDRSLISVSVGLCKIG